MLLNTSFSHLNHLLVIYFKLSEFLIILAPQASSVSLFWFVLESNSLRCGFFKCSLSIYLQLSSCTEFYHPSLHVQARIATKISINKSFRQGLNIFNKLANTSAKKIKAAKAMPNCLCNMSIQTSCAVMSLRSKKKAQSTNISRRHDATAINIMTTTLYQHPINSCLKYRFLSF